MYMEEIISSDIWHFQRIKNAQRKQIVDKHKALRANVTAKAMLKVVSKINEMILHFRYTFNV